MSSAVAAVEVIAPVSTVMRISLEMTLSVLTKPVADLARRETKLMVMMTSTRADPPSQTQADGKRDEILVISLRIANYGNGLISWVLK
jgi:hypothetical protein